MKIRPIEHQPEVPLGLLNDRLKDCQKLVLAYHTAMKEHKLQAAHSARLGISLFVPSGVYKRGGSDRDEFFAVYGIIRSSKKLVSPERLFVVPVIPVREIRGVPEVDEDGEITGTWKKEPLIDTDGFLVPKCRDGYHGARYVRVGDIVHY